VDPEAACLTKFAWLVHPFSFYPDSIGLLKDRSFFNPEKYKVRIFCPPHKNTFLLATKDNFIRSKGFWEVYSVSLSHFIFDKSVFPPLLVAHVWRRTPLGISSRI
jgi:hypothetical protein